MNNKIGLLGIPLDFNSSYLHGPAEAPSAIRSVLESGSMNWSSESGYDLSALEQIEDLGNLAWETQATAFPLIQKTVDEHLASGYKVLSLGGDHSISFPIMQAYAKHFANLTILHFDAHADLYDDFEGNPHSHASPFARIMENNLVSRLVQVGIRTLCPHQRAQVERFNVEVLEMQDWSLEKADQLNISGDVYISFDIDGLDPSCAPGVSHHEPGGLLMRDVLTFIQRLNANVVGADVVEYNPRQDFKNNMTGFVAAKLVKELLAKML